MYNPKGQDKKTQKQLKVAVMNNLQILGSSSSLIIIIIIIISSNSSCCSSSSSSVSSSSNNNSIKLWRNISTKLISDSSLCT